MVVELVRYFVGVSGKEVIVWVYIIDCKLLWIVLSEKKYFVWKLMVWIVLIIISILEFLVSKFI